MHNRLYALRANMNSNPRERNVYVC